MFAVPKPPARHLSGRDVEQEPTRVSGVEQGRMATQWLQNDRLVSRRPTKNPWKIRGLRHGPSGTRTPDPLIKSQLL
jgi:hypothetical protein